MDGMFSPPHLFATTAPTGRDLPFRSSSFSALDVELPENVMLLTLSRIGAAAAADDDDGTLTLLLRLAHQYAEGESEELSGPVSVDLRGLLSGYDVIAVVEKTLSGIQDLSSWNERRLSWESEPESGRAGGIGGGPDGGNIQLNPMEIRTFEVKANAKDLRTQTQ